MRGRHWLLIGTAAAVAALLAARAAAPRLALERVNAAMRSMGPYTGEVADVDLAIWRAGYTLHGLRIRKKGGPQTPFVDGARVDVDVGWPALLTGEGTARVRMSGAHIAFVDAATPEGAQAGEEVAWQGQLHRAAPVPVDVLELRDATVRLRNADVDPPVDVEVSGVHGAATGLATPGQVRIELAGTTAGEAAVQFEADIEGDGRPQRANLRLHVQGLPLTAVNDLLHAYAGIDVHAGTATATLQARYADGRIQGHGQLHAQDLDVFSWRADTGEGEGLPALLREAAAGIVAAVKRDAQGRSEFRNDFSVAWQPDRDDSLEALLEIGRLSIAGAAAPLTVHESTLAALP